MRLRATLLRLCALLLFVLSINRQAIAQAPYFKWAKGFIPGAFPSYCTVNAIAIDAVGDIYATGYFNGTVDFDPGPGIQNLTSAGGRDIFVCKLDTSGNYLWAKTMGGSVTDMGYSIAVDSSGSVYTSGIFSGIADFDPGPSAYILTSIGNYDIFVSKLDSSGNFVWARGMGGTDVDYAYGIAVDANANVYTTGSFRRTADFDPGSGVANLTSTASDDIFVSKLDASGNYLWAKDMGSGGIDYGVGIALDSSGNVYTTGAFQGSAYFDPASHTQTLTSLGGFDIFVSKLDKNGAYGWAKSFGGTVDDYGYSIAIDAVGNVYTTGIFKGTVDFDPGSGVQNVSSVAFSYDIFVSKLNASGTYTWAKSMGGSSDDFGQSVAVDGRGSVFTTGNFYGTADFDPGPTTQSLASIGPNSTFISKLDANGGYAWAKAMGGSGYDIGNSIAIDGRGNAYTAGSFQDTVNFDPTTGVSNLASPNGDGSFVQKMASCNTISLATSFATDTLSTILVNGNIQPLAFTSNCNDIALLRPSGGRKVIGLIGATVYVNNPLPQYNGNAYCRRDYAVTPAAIDSAATGTLTLYFTQADFDDYNNNNSAGYYLPSSASDVAGIGSLRIRQELGISSNGNPGSYSGNTVTINPPDSNIVWNNSSARWEITLDIKGFGGFFVYGSAKSVGVAWPPGSAEKGHVHVAPSPAQDFLRIATDADNLSAILSDMQGRVYQSFGLSDGQKLNIANLSAGIYLLRVSNGETVKVIKE